MSFKGLKRKFSFVFINHFFKGTRFFELKRKLLNFAGYKIGENTKIVGPIFITSNLEIGSNCWIGRNFSCEGNGKVIIGNNCDIAPNVTFLTGGHKIGNKKRRAGQGEVYSINVENAVWIGANSTIGRNINIGASSVIAACSCVMKDVDENILIGGVPAKKIRCLDD